ncbi:MAG: hypothetical protein ACRD2W_23100 [Acidimicrobiales bacterium]
MAALLVVQAVALALLAVLVWGLLRSHAEILRSLHRLGAGVDPDGPGTGPRDQPVSIGTPRPRRPATAIATATAAVDLIGTSPRGEPVQVGVRTDGEDTLVAFLSSSCSTCAEFWRAFAGAPEALELPAGTRLVIVTRAMAEEDAGGIDRLAPDDHPVVMSTEAWRDYGVPATPYFIHVDGPTGEIVGQGAGATWSQVSSLLRQATGDDHLVRSRRSARQSVAEQEADVDRRLLAAGIRPGDPRLYPGRPADDEDEGAT